MKKILNMCLVALLILSSQLETEAYVKGINDDKDVAAWNQGSDNWSRESGIGEINKTVLLQDDYIGAETIEEGGCGLFVATYMLVKTGEVNPDIGENHLTVLKKLKDEGLFELGFHVDDSGNNVEKYSKVLKQASLRKLNRVIRKYDRTLKVNTSYMIPIKELGLKRFEAYNLVKHLYNEGYFIKVCFKNKENKAHYVFVDSMNKKGDLIIGDSAKDTVNMRDYVEDENISWNYITVFESKSGLKSCDLPSIYKSSKIYNDLMIENRFSIWYVVGVVLLIYIGLIIFCFLFDRFNNVLSFSLLPIVSFGLLSAYSRKELENIG